MIIQSQVLREQVTFVRQTLSSCAAHWRPRRIWKLSKLFQLIRYWLKLVRLQYEIECDKLRSYCLQWKVLLDTCGPGKNGESWCKPQFSTIETSLVTEYTQLHPPCQATNFCDTKCDCSSLGYNRGDNYEGLSWCLQTSFLRIVWGE